MDGAKYRISLDPQARITIAATNTGESFAETFTTNQLHIFTPSSHYTGTILLHGQ